MRLIDADALANALFDRRKNYPQWVADVIGNIPEAVVRCKNCEWWGIDRECGNSDSPCFHNGCTHGDWFCADGERKEVK